MVADVGLSPKLLGTDQGYGLLRIYYVISRKTLEKLSFSIAG
jgi:hypothetical protein